MKPTKETIRALSPPQRKVIQRIQTAGEYRRRYDVAGVALLRILEAKKIIQLKPGFDCLYILMPEWETVDVDIPQRVRKVYLPTEKTPRPDPPRKMMRPPAIYSNRSREELIDNILNKR